MATRELIHPATGVVDWGYRPKKVVHTHFTCVKLLSCSIASKHLPLVLAAVELHHRRAVWNPVLAVIRVRDLTLPAPTPNLHHVLLPAVCEPVAFVDVEFGSRSGLPDAILARADAIAPATTHTGACVLHCIRWSLSGLVLLNRTGTAAAPRGH